MIRIASYLKVGASLMFKLGVGFGLAAVAFSVLTFFSTETPNFSTFVGDADDRAHQAWVMSWLLAAVLGVVGLLASALRGLQGRLPT
jgi:hypothetical protein